MRGGLVPTILYALMSFVPLCMPLSGDPSVTSGFGYRADPFLGRLALHPGVDTWNIARSALAGIARRDLGYRGWIRRISQELPHLAHIVPRVPQLAVRYLQHQHDQTANRQQVQLAHDLDRESRRTRKLLWICAACGGLLGLGVVLLL